MAENKKYYFLKLKEDFFFKRDDTAFGRDDRTAYKARGRHC